MSVQTSDLRKRPTVNTSEPPAATPQGVGLGFDSPRRLQRHPVNGTFHRHFLSRCLPQ